MSYVNSAFCETDSYQRRTLWISPRNDGKTLPDEEHFRAFFSKFGSILDLCRHSTSKSNIDHVYLIYKTEDAVQSLKDYLRLLEEASFWKQSCRIAFSPSKCPVDLIKRVEANAGSAASSSNSSYTHRESKRASGSAELNTKGTPIQVGISRLAHAGSSTQSLGKRGADTFSQGEYQSKRKRFTDEPTMSEPMLDKLFFQNTQDHSRVDDSEVGNVYHTTRNLSSPRTPTQKSALQLAQQAADIASSRSKRAQLTRERQDGHSELEQMRAERDAAIESCRALEQEVRQLKSFIKEKRKKEEKVFRLVTASLQSLHESSEVIEE